MCGIAGWFDPRGERMPDASLARAMTRALAHRGPDGDGLHLAPGLALGHRRLSIIDLAGGAQPMHSADARLTIVFNGEIYNFRALRSELERLGHGFRTRSDTEVILAAYAQWGVEALTRIEGMFALALWDAREQSLLLARDRLGEKPLYYTHLPDGALAFASEMKALLVNPDLPRRIDPYAIEEFFSYGYIPDPRSIYQDIRKLEAASYLLYKRGSAPRSGQYWSLADIGEGPSTLDEAAAQLRARLAQAVEAQRVADVPLGTFLSGGVDSAGITALAAEASPDPLNCFTIGFNDPQFDERRYAATVAVRYHAHQHVETMDGDELDSVFALPGIFDEPFGDSSALPTLHLARLARRHVTVALSGDGGDELFAGYRRYLFHGREERLRSLLPLAIRRPVFGALAQIYPQADWAPRFLRARQTFRELSTDSAAGFFHNVCVTGDGLRARLFAPELRRALGGYHAQSVVARHLAEAPFDDAIACAQYVDVKTWLSGDILTKVDRTAMSVSLEVRVPMLDPNFVRFAFSLPRALKLDGANGKRVLKRALEPLLPDALLYRPKQGFSVPLARWFRGPLGSRFADEMGQGGMAAFIAPDMAGRLLSEHRTGLADHSRTLWLLWMFHGFLKRHEERPAAIREIAATV